VLAVAVASEQQRMGDGIAETAQNEIWLPRQDSNLHPSAARGRRLPRNSGRRPRYRPTPRRSAREGGRPASRILRCAPATS
jgi:hypothetical protein